MPLLDAADQALVREALNLDATQLFPVCAFYAHSNSNRNKDWIEQYIPSDEIAPDPKDQDQVGWRLLSIEGREPKARELSRYEHRGGTLYPESTLDELVDFSALKVIEREPHRVIFQTKPLSQFLEENRAKQLDEHVVTRIVINSDTRRLEQVSTALDSEVRPNAFMKVYAFKQSLNYSFVPEVGEVILTELDMNADVKFVVVRRNFYLSARIYDFSCPEVLQPQTCPEPEPRDTD